MSLKRLFLTMILSCLFSMEMHAQAPGEPIAPGLLKWTQEALYPDCDFTAFWCHLQKARGYIFNTKPPFGRSVALLVGVSEYDSYDDLPWVQRDVDRMRAALLKSGFDTVYTMDGALATRDLLNLHIKTTIKDDLQPGDRFLFYFSGHGDDLGGNTGYMLLPKAKAGGPVWSSEEAVPNTQLIEWSGDLKHTKHILFILDSCSAGLGFEHVSLVSKGLDGETMAIAATLGGEGSREVLTAGTSGEKAYGNEEGSLFTNAILELLEEGQHSGDLVTSRAMQDRAAQKAAAASAKGLRFTPRRWKLPRDPGRDGTFVFINPNNELAGIQSPNRLSKKQTVSQDKGALNRSPGSRQVELPASTSGPIMIRLDSGKYRMGIDDGKPHEGPAHSVEIRTFEISKTEVTVAQYAACVEAGICSIPSLQGLQCNWGKSERLTHPINCISWFEARSYAEWLGLRLPSESEWEYAARSGGRDQRYPWGDEVPNCSHAITSECGNITAPVCSAPQGNTDQGLCDTSGNVQEWVEDDWHDSYRKGFRKRPSDELPWLDKPRAVARSVRGGSVGQGPTSTRVTERSPMPPEQRDVDIGFRVARSLENEATAENAQEKLGIKIH